MRFVTIDMRFEKADARRQPTLRPVIQNSIIKKKHG